MPWYCTGADTDVGTGTKQEAQNRACVCTYACVCVFHITMQCVNDIFTHLNKQGNDMDMERVQQVDVLSLDAGPVSCKGVPEGSRHSGSMCFVLQGPVFSSGL